MSTTTLYDTNPQTGTVSTTNLTSLYSNTTNFTSGVVNSSVYSVNGGVGVTVDPTTGNVLVSIGQDVATSANPTFNNLTLTGDLAVNGGDITTTASTTNLFASASTITIGNDSTTVNIGRIDIDGRTTTNTNAFTTTSTATVTLVTSTRNVSTAQIYIVQGTNVHTVSATVLRVDSTTALFTTYGEMYNNIPLANFSGDVAGGNLRILVTPTSATSTTFSVVRTSLT